MKSLPDFTSPAARGFRRLVFGAVTALLLAALALAADWLTPRPLRPWGGRYFFHTVEIDVPLFRQADPRWAADPLGPTGGTLGAEGCAVASAAMVLGFYGIDTDPGRLNAFLTGSGGFTPQGWLYWEGAAALAPDRVTHVYEDLPSYHLIDSNLAHGNPVIVRLRYPSGITHFVVIAGKRGFDYLVRDPGRGADKGLYPLREFGSEIEALRFYRKEPKVGAGARPSRG